MKIVFATNNLHKLSEIKKLLPKDVELLSLQDILCNEEIPEDYETLEENALQKAQHIFKKYGFDCFADDTGMEIKVLNCLPGVHSARYAGDDKNSEKNIQKVLQALKDKTDRSAQFRTVIALILRGKTYFFEGIVKGIITREKMGVHGFGYDPIFRPIGYNKTFAEMELEEKNKISHRALAVNKLTDFLKNVRPENHNKRPG